MIQNPNQQSQRNTNQHLIVKDPKVNMLKLQLNPTDLVGTINCQITKTMEDLYFKNYLAENLDTWENIDILTNQKSKYYYQPWNMFHIFIFWLEWDKSMSKI